MNRRPLKPVPLHDPKTAAQALRTYTGAALPVFIDYEFNRSNHPHVNLVSCSVFVPDWADQPREWWLHNRPDQVADLAAALRELHDAGAVFYGYAIAAEARATLSVGIDPHLFRWVDLYAEWCQLTYNNVECEYGTYYTKTGFRRVSTPPYFDKERNKGRDNTAVGRGLIDAAAQCFDLFIDSARKREMRDLIIADRERYTPAEQSDIMAYCSDDVRYLPALAWELSVRLNRSARLDFATVGRVQQRRGAYSVSVGKMEEVGFPLRVDAVRNLRRNFDLAQDSLISDLVENHYPFYIRQKKRAADLVGQWTDKYDAFVEFIRSRGLYDTWPRTTNADTGERTETLSREDKVLGEYDGIPELYQYRQVKKQIKQLSWFREPDEAKRTRDGDFFDSVGPDDRLRTFLGPYGTQTGRNAPKASRFVLAMSSWLRCLIEPPPGWCIIGIDYASQEFAIAAIMSGDDAMVEAYESGDPYLFFAKRAGAVPLDADPKGCKDPARVLRPFVGPDFDLSHGIDDATLATLPDDARALYAAYKGYKFQRNLFKSTTLGLQYGMGAAKLAVKLSADLGVRFTQDDAAKLISLHRKVYRDFWRWSDRIGVEYERAHVLTLWDGWALLGDNDNMLSVKNFPVQGTGGVIMREAVRLAHQRGLGVLSPLHDAIYSLAPVDKKKEHTDALAECMEQAVVNVIGPALKIRLDIDVHEHGEIWQEEKGEKFYKLLSKYLERLPTSDDRKNHLLTTIFGGE